jgi:hypothetical protein
MNYAYEAFSESPEQAFCLFLLLSAIASLSYGGVVFNGSPGTAAPPNTLGGLQVFPFPLDPRTLGVDETFVNPAFDCPSSLLLFRTFEPQKNWCWLGNLESWLQWRCVCIH